YNSVDVGRVFSMGAALMRRWATIPVPPLDSDELTNVLKSKVPTIPTDAIVKIKQLYELHLELLPFGPAPFIDMARYVCEEGDGTPAVGADTGGMSETEAVVLR